LLGWGPSVHAVDGVTFEVRRGETLGLSASPERQELPGADNPSPHQTRCRPGSIEGIDTLQVSSRKLRALRRDLQIVFQDPYSSLNPRSTVRRILAEPLIIHGIDRQRREARIGEMLTWSA